MINFKMIYKYILYQFVEPVLARSLITYFFLPMKMYVDMYVPIVCPCVLLLIPQWGVKILGAWLDHLNAADCSCEMLV